MMLSHNRKIACGTVIAASPLRCVYFLWMVGAASFGTIAAPGLGQDVVPPTHDRVHYGAALPRSTNVWNATPVVVLTGKIDQLDSISLEITTLAGERRKMPSDRIERIDVAWDNDEARAAHQRYTDQQYLLALKENDEVLHSGRIPKWQQCILLAELVEAARAVDRAEVAGELFLVLAQQSPPDFLWATIPLNWTSEESSPAMDKASRIWLAGPDDTAALIGASWLLMGDQAEAAKKRLQAIVAGPSKLLQRLSTMQLWRTVPPTEASGNTERWLAARETLLLPLQLGPTEFLAERFARTGKTDLAVGEWLRVAASHPDHSNRAQIALRAAENRLPPTDGRDASARVEKWMQQLGTSNR